MLKFILDQPHSNLITMETEINTVMAVKILGSFTELVQLQRGLRKIRPGTNYLKSLGGGLWLGYCHPSSSHYVIGNYGTEAQGIEKFLTQFS